MIYLFVILLLFFLIYRYDYLREERGRLVWLVIVAVLLSLIGGLRYRIGFDTPSYIKFFDKINDISSIKYEDIEASRFAPGFLIVSSICKYFTKEVWLLQLVEAFCICGSATWFFNKNTKNPFFALLLFVSFMYAFLVYEQIREGFAVSVFLWAWPFFRDRQWIKWYLMAFLSMSFHTSGIIMFILPVICLPWIREIFIFGRRTVFLCILALVVAFLVQEKFFVYLNLIAVTDSMADFAERYTGTIWSGGQLNLSGIIGFLFRYIFYPIIAMTFLNKGIKYTQNEEKVKNLLRVESLSLMSIYVSIFSVAISIILRYDNYFFFFSILVMSDFIFEYLTLGYKKIRLQFAYWVIFFIPLFGMQIYSYIGYVNKTGTLRTYMAYYPYNSYLDMKKDDNREKLFTFQKKQRKTI